MFIKLGIMICAVIVGGLIFANEINTFLPTTSASVADSLKEDVTNLGNNATDSVEQRLDESIDKVLVKSKNTATNQLSGVGEIIANEMAVVNDSIEQVFDTFYDTIINNELLANNF